MDCEEFLENYSDFLDRRLEDRPLVAYRDHLKSCPSCAQYDRVMHDGLRLVRQLPAPQPDPHFFNRLRARLFHVENERPAVRQALGAAALVVVSLLAGLSVHSVLDVREPVQLPPIVVEASQPTVDGSLWGGVPSLGRSIAGPNLLLVPRFSEQSLLIAPPGRVSLFRAPLKTSIPPPRPDGRSE